jgi:hypothetical protein
MFGENGGAILTRCATIATMNKSSVTCIAVIIHLDMARIELNRLNKQESRVHTELLLLPLVGPALLRLVLIGVKEHDIVSISELIEMDGNKNDMEEAQLLIEEVRNVGGIKAAIRRLNQQPEGKRKEEESFVIKEIEDSLESIIGDAKRRMHEHGIRQSMDTN